jgi:hypothetical protein
MLGEQLVLTLPALGRIVPAQIPVAAVNPDDREILRLVAPVLGCRGKRDVVATR